MNSKSISVTVGSSVAFQPVFQVADSYGNLLSGETLTLSLFRTNSSCNDPYSSSIATGITAATNNSGFANFNGFAVAVAGDFYLRASIGTLYSACSDSIFNLTATSAAISSLSFTSLFGAVETAGALFTATPTLTAYDSFGNPAVGQIVSLRPFIDSSCMSLSSLSLNNAVSKVDAAGIVTFPNISYLAKETIYLGALTNGIFRFLMELPNFLILPFRFFNCLLFNSYYGSGIIIAGILLDQKPFFE